MGHGSSSQSGSPSDYTGRGLLGEVDEEGRQVGEGVVLVDVDCGGGAAQVDGADDHGAVDGEGSGAVVAQGGAGAVDPAVDGDVRSADQAEGSGVVAVVDDRQAAIGRVGHGFDPGADGS